MAEDVKLFTAPGCEGCTEIKEAYKKGVEIDGVPEGTSIKFIDVTSDEGGDLVEEYDLSQVPAAYYQGKRCDLSIDADTGKVLVECGTSKGQSVSLNEAYEQGTK